MTLFTKLLDLTKKASLYSTEKTEFEDINHDLEYWRSQADKNAQNDVVNAHQQRREQTIQTFNHIINRYLNGGIDIRHQDPEIEDVAYSEYAKFIKTNHDQNYLLKTILEKIEQDDPSVPTLMIQIISFFDRVSKLTDKEKNLFLGQFPVPQEDFYKCGPGIGVRLDGVMFQMEDYVVQFVNGVIEKKTSQLLKFVDESLEPHVTALLYYVLCGATKDTNFLMPVSDLAAKDIWDFSRNLVTKYNENTDEHRKKALELKAAYDDYISKYGFEVDLTHQHKLIEFLLNDDFLIKECGLTSDYQKLWGMFIDENDQFILDEKGAPIIQYKIEEIIYKYSEIQTKEDKDVKEVVVDEQAKDISEMNLYDEDMPEKIAQILTNPSNSTPHQIHLAVSAIWIMMESFKGNSKVNFVKALDLIARFGSDVVDMSFEDRMSRVKGVFDNLLQNPKVSESTKMLVNHIYRDITVGDKQMVQIDYIAFQLPFNKTLNLKEFVFDFKCSAELLDNFNFDSKEFLGALSGFANEDVVSMIFFNPKRDKLLEKFIAINDQDYSEKQKDILLSLIKQAVDKVDLDLLKQIMEGVNLILTKDEILTHIFSDLQDILIEKSDKQMIDYIFSTTLDANGKIDSEKAEEYFFEDSGKLLFIAIENGKFEIVSSILNSLTADSFKDLMLSPKYGVFYNIVKSNKQNLINFIIDKLIKDFTDEERAQIVWQEFGRSTPSILRVAIEKLNLKSVDFIISTIPHSKKDKRQIKELLSKRDLQGNTTLLLAIKSKRLDLVKSIFDLLDPKDFVSEMTKNSDAMAPDNFDTLFHEAISTQNPKIVEFLLNKFLESNPEIDGHLEKVFGIGGFDDRTILHAAFESCNQEIIELLMSKISDEALLGLMEKIDAAIDPILFLAIKNHQFYELEERLGKILKSDIGDAKERIKELIFCYDSPNQSPILSVINAMNLGTKDLEEIDGLKAMEFIIDVLDPSEIKEAARQENYEGFASFHLIAQNECSPENNLKAMKLILSKLDEENKIELINQNSQDGLSPLEIAYQKGKIEIAMYLIANGAKITQRLTKSLIESCQDYPDWLMLLLVMNYEETEEQIKQALKDNKIDADAKEFLQKAILFIREKHNLVGIEEGVNLESGLFENAYKKCKSLMGKIGIKKLDRVIKDFSKPKVVKKRPSSKPEIDTGANESVANLQKKFTPKVH